MALNAPEELQLLLGEVAAQGEDGIERGRAVALAHDEAVPLRGLRARGVYAELFEIQLRQYVHRRKRAANMPARGAEHHIHAQAPPARGDELKLPVCHGLASQSVSENVSRGIGTYELQIIIPSAKGHFNSNGAAGRRAQLQKYRLPVWQNAIIIIYLRGHRRLYPQKIHSEGGRFL